MRSRLYSHYKLIIKTTCCAGLILAVLIAIPVCAIAQQYSFTHYDIEDGLTQSQIRAISQDKSHQLLVATRLGIGRFDGRAFTSFTKDNGLPDNVVSAITTDNEDRIWGSGPNSLYYCYGGQVRQDVAKGGDAFKGASALLTDANNTVWGIKGRLLFNIKDGYARQVTVLSLADTINCIAKSTDGVILAAIQNKGVFRLEKDHWQQVITADALKGKGIIKQLVADKPGHFYLLTDRYVLSVQNNIVQPVPVISSQVTANSIYCLCPDDQHGLWIGAFQGAYHLNLDNNNWYILMKAMGLPITRLIVFSGILIITSGWAPTARVCTGSTGIVL